MKNFISRTFLIHQDEQRETFYFLSLFILIGLALGFGKGITETLFLARFGIEFLPMMFMLTALGLLITGLIYGSVVDIITPHRLMSLLIGFTVAIIISSWILIKTMTVVYIYPALYLLLETTSDLFAVHLMFYVSQNLHLSQSKRLSPIILSGLSIGGMISGLGLGLGTLILSLDDMLWLWILALLLGAWITNRYHQLHGPSPFFHANKNAHSITQSLKNIQFGVVFTRRSPLLLALCVSLFFTVLAYYTLKYLINLAFVSNVPDEAALAALIGSVIAFNSIAGLLLQTLVTNRFFEKFGIRIANLIFPTAMIMSNALFLFGLYIPTAIIGSFTRDALMSAFRNPSYNLFFAALPPAMQGRSRSMTLMFVLPVSLLCVGLLLHFIQQPDTHLPITIIGVISTIVLLWASTRTNNVYYDTLITTMREATYLGKSGLETQVKSSSKTLEEMKTGLQSDERLVVLYYAKRLMNLAPEEGASAILQTFENHPNHLKIELAELLVGHRPDELGALLWQCFDSCEDQQEACAILHLLMDIEEGVYQKASRWVSEHSSSCTDGIRLRQLIYENPDNSDIQSSIESLLQSSDPESSKIVLNILLRHRDVTLPESLLDQLHSSAEQNVLVTLELISGALDSFPENKLIPSLEKVFGRASFKVKLAIINVLSGLNSGASKRFLFTIFKENHQKNVRMHALCELKRCDGIPDSLLEDIYNERLTYSSQKIVLDSSELVLPKAYIKSLIEKRVSMASELHEYLEHVDFQAVKTLQNSLLETLLNEKLRQTIDICLTALSQIDDKKGIQIVRAVLGSHDRQYSGLAYEALKNLNNTDISDSIIKLLAYLLDPDKESPGKRSIDISLARDWCLKHCSTWARQCLSNTQDNYMISFLEKTLLLKKSRIFGELDTEDIQSIAEILVEDFYQAGDRVFDLGDVSDKCYIIKSGRIGISLHQEHENKDYVAVLAEGDYFGEMGILDDNLRSASAHVIEDTQLLSISRVQFHNIIQQHPQIALSMLTRMNLIVRGLDKKLALQN